MSWSGIPTWFRSLSSLFAHKPYRQLSHINRLVGVAILFCSVVGWSISNSSKPVTASAAWRDHVIDLLLTNFHLVGVVEEARFVSCFVLRIVERTLLNSRLSS